MITDQFIPHVDREYGAGYFCTPDIFEALQFKERCFQDWQSIETAPTDGAAVLGKLPDSDCPVVIFFKKGKWHVKWDLAPLVGSDVPTHWIPLPVWPIV